MSAPFGLLSYYADFDDSDKASKIDSFDKTADRAINGKKATPFGVAFSFAQIMLRLLW